MPPCRTCSTSNLGIIISHRWVRVGTGLVAHLGRCKFKPSRESTDLSTVILSLFWISLQPSAMLTPYILTLVNWAAFSASLSNLLCQLYILKLIIASHCFTNIFSWDRKKCLVSSLGIWTHHSHGVTLSYILGLQSRWKKQCIWPKMVKKTT